MDQNVRIEDGSGNIIVQAVTSTVTVGMPPQLKLLPRHRRRRPPKSDIELLSPFTDAIPFAGREAELARLRDWLLSPALICARCLIGRTGTGKTRLALQLCERAEAMEPEWDAGFVEHRELERFASLQNLSAWGWQRRTLIVVDYAAGIARWLQPWLEELAQNPGQEGVPLRLLLLERFAYPGIGWWGELKRTGFSDANMRDLFDPPEPEPLLPIGAEERPVLIQSIVSVAERMKGEASPSVNRMDLVGRAMRFAGHADEADALDLLMAGLMETRQLASDPDQRVWSRSFMGTVLAEHELERVERLAKDRRINFKMLAHLAAMVTLGGGIEFQAARAMIDEELVALPRKEGGSALDLRDALRDTLPEVGSGRIAAIVPDLVGEAFLLHVFGRLGGLTPEEQDEAIGRSYRRSPDDTIATVIHTAQDFAETDDHPALRWIDVLGKMSTTIEDAFRLLNAMESSSVVLLEKTAAMTSALLELMGPLPSPQRIVPMAALTSNLALRLDELGKSQIAAIMAFTSTAMFRAWAKLMPDIEFRPHLAGSLNILANVMSNIGESASALDAASEAVGCIS